MTADNETVDQSAFSRLKQRAAKPTPGLLLVFSAGEPLAGAIPLPLAGLDVGRGHLAGVELRDGRMSRQHAFVSRRGNRWVIKDHGSRNGSAVDGVAVQSGTEVEGETSRILRTGETLFMLCNDVGPYIENPLEIVEGCVVGARMHQVFAQVRRAAGLRSLHITGETGSGKEIAARAFHRMGPLAGGPFVAVNCAAIPDGVAERLLFGARKGAFSGAVADADGYIQAADGGTLFLDEVGELDLSVQAKLLRVLETKEVMALGAARPRKVDLQICSATHQDLRQAVNQKRFREDLFYRLARPAVLLPPLRERIEDIPFLIDRQIRSVSARLSAHVSFVEACLLRPWPGNVRELLLEVRDAAAAAVVAEENILRGLRLSALAGQTLALDSFSQTPGESGSEAPEFPTAEQITETLRRCDGRVATAARALGIHRTQLRRWLQKHQLEVPASSADDSAP